MDKEKIASKWEVSISPHQTIKEKKYWKVTRRLPEMYVAETKVFDSEEEAIKQHKEWLL